MADTKISALTDGATANGTDAIPAARAGANVRITPAYIKTYMFTSGTITTSQPLSFTQTWNAGGVTFQGFVIDITNTSSAAASEAFRAGVGGVAGVTIRRDGAIGSDTLFSAGMMLNDASAMALFGRYSSVATSKNIAIGDDGGTAPGMRMASTFLYGWSSTSNATQAADTALARNAAGKVEINNGTAGTLRDLTVRHLAASGAQIDFTALPSSDPGVPGRLYRTAGAVMVSL